MLGPWIALTADRKPYAGNPMVLSDLTCNVLGRSFQGHLGLYGLYSMETMHVRPSDCIDSG